MRLASNFGCGFTGSGFFGGSGVSAFCWSWIRLLGVLLQRFGNRIDLLLRLFREGLLRFDF